MRNTYIKSIDLFSLIKNDNIFKILNLAEKNNFNIWIVGGAIRDFFLNRSINDFDFVYDIKPLELVEILKTNKLDFNSINLSDHYEAYRVIDEGKNQICSWSDSLSDDGKKISYDEYTYNTTQCMDFENWIHIDKNGLGKSAFKWFCMYLKSINGRADRLEKLKRVLDDMNIPFEEGDWQTIDRDCERNKLN